MRAFSKTLLLSTIVGFSQISASDLPDQENNSNDLPIVLDSDNFYDKVIDLQDKLVIGNKPWFIEFFAPWCPHCQHLAPVWDMLYQIEKDDVNVARVDCTSTKGRPLCTEY